MGLEKPCHRDRVKELFRAAHASKRHGEFVERMKSLRATAESEEQFREDFIWCLKHVMIIYERTPSVERVIDFAAMFALAAEDDNGVQNQKTMDRNTSLSEDNQPAMSEFLTCFFNFLLDSYEANDKAVRFRVCQLINKLLNQMSDDASIDNNIADQIYDCMLVRVRDKFPNVRVQAIAALARLQDPQDPECQVISSYLRIMETDKSAEVRRAALSNVALSTQTLPFIIERTRDITEKVRKLAFRILAEKVNIRAFTIAQRLQLLENGLGDRSEEVKKSAKNLMDVWMQSLDGQVTKFLNCLHVETSGKTPEVVLDAMFKDMSKDDLQECINTLHEYNESSDTVNIGYEELSCENALYWRYLAQYVKKSGVNCDELLDQLIPELSVFCTYIRGFVDTKLMSRSDSDEEEQQLAFILRQLLLLTGIFDQSDEVGRKELQELIRSLLVNEAIPLSLVSVLIERYRDVQPDEDSRIHELVEIIADIRQPIVTEETPQILEEKRKLEVKMAGIRVKLNQYREELQESVKKQEFSKAAELKQLIGSLEQERTDLQEEDEKISSASIREERDDPWILERCLTISCEMLQGIRKRGLSPTLRTLAETLFLTPGIQNEDPQVRNVAVMCLGMTALQDLDFAKQFLVLFLQVAQVDVELVRVNALKVIFDLLLLFGSETLMVGHSVPEEEDNLDVFDEEEEKPANKSATEEDSDNSNEEDQSVKKTASWMFSFLTSLLDSESGPLRQVVAEGMARLLLAGRIRSTEVLSRLVLLWYSPETDDDCRLKHCLGVFLPTFACASRVNQELVEEAFLPTLKTIFDAPVDSPLASINVNDVASLFVQLCDSNSLDATAKKSSMNNSVSTIHISLALKIANEILADVDSPYIKVLCRTLTLLDLSGCDLPNVKDLKVLLDDLLEYVDGDVALRYLTKFQSTLELLDTSSPEGETKTTGETSDEESNNNGEDGNSAEQNTSNCTETDRENGESGSNGDSARNEAKTIEEGNDGGRPDPTTEESDRIPLIVSIEKDDNRASMAPPSSNQKTKSKESKQGGKFNRMQISKSCADTPASRTRSRRNRHTTDAQHQSEAINNSDSYEGGEDVFAS